MLQDLPCEVLWMVFDSPGLSSLDLLRSVAPCSRYFRDQVSSYHASVGVRLRWLGAPHLLAVIPSSTTRLRVDHVGPGEWTRAHLPPNIERLRIGLDELKGLVDAPVAPRSLRRLVVRVEKPHHKNAVKKVLSSIAKKNKEGLRVPVIERIRFEYRLITRVFRLRCETCLPCVVANHNHGGVMRISSRGDVRRCQRPEERVARASRASLTWDLAPKHAT